MWSVLGRIALVYVLIAIILPASTFLLSLMDELQFYDRVVTNRDYRFAWTVAEEMFRTANIGFAMLIAIGAAIRIYRFTLEDHFAKRLSDKE